MELKSSRREANEVASALGDFLSELIILKTCQGWNMPKMLNWSLYDVKKMSEVSCKTLLGISQMKSVFLLKQKK